MVKDDEIMYLEYYTWLDGKNTDNLNPNQYLKQCEMIRLLREVKEKPRYVIFENVANITSKVFSETLKLFKQD